MAFQTSITVAEALERIQRSEYVLPAILPEFEWRSHQITALGDLLMRGYPIGTFPTARWTRTVAVPFKFCKLLSHSAPADRWTALTPNPS